jgi:hypothetical protein
MEGVSNAELLAELRAICGGHERAVELLDELDARLDTVEWELPPDVQGELRQATNGRTIPAFITRAKFAHQVWLDKYGPFNVEQGQYVRELLLWVIRTSGGDRGKLLGRLDDLVNHESVDAGFKRRKGDVPEVKFDAMELLQ